MLCLIQNNYLLAMFVAKSSLVSVFRSKNSRLREERCPPHAAAEQLLSALIYAPNVLADCEFAKTDQEKRSV